MWEECGNFGWMLLLHLLLFLREIFENGISWLIDWLVVFCWNKFGIGVENFWKKKWRLYLFFCWLRKKQVLRIMDWLNLNGTNNHKSNIVVVIVCWWWLFCFENRGRFDVVAFVFLKEDQVYLCNYSIVVFILIG